VSKDPLFPNPLEATVEPVLFTEEEIREEMELLRISKTDALIYLENAIRDIFFPPTEESSQKLVAT
jgi:hypothetical protein